MKLILMVAGAALLSATGALAADQDKDKEAAGEETVAQETAAKPEMLQCRYEKVTGSRTKAYRICLTKKEWRHRAVTEHEKLDRMRRGESGA